MNEFDKAKQRAERKKRPSVSELEAVLDRKDLQVEVNTDGSIQAAPVKRPLNDDAVVTITIESREGTITKGFRILGYTGNTVAWQRKGKELEQRLADCLKHGFGGQVRVE